jgi:aspartyl-tRNA(Asn)/glutamyl-tRNA(Gln) amidotransferase subunit A
VGVPRECNVTELSASVRESWAACAHRLRSLGATVVPVSLPTTALALAAYYILVSAEASSNLARYDGVRYGARTDAHPAAAVTATSLHAAYARSRSAAFGEEVQRRLLVRAFVGHLHLCSQLRPSVLTTSTCPFCAA